MGLEIGPNGHLYYVDNGQDEVVRIDPYTDEDGDGIGDRLIIVHLSRTDQAISIMTHSETLVMRMTIMIRF